MAQEEVLTVHGGSQFAQMISLDRALFVLLLGVLLQAILQLRGSGTAVWRSNVAAELALADTLLEHRPDEGDALLLAAFETLEVRKRLVEGQIAQHDAMPWFQRALYDTSSFQAHADWLKSWRQEWSERLAAKPAGTLPRRATSTKSPSGGLQSAVEVAQDAIKGAAGDWKAAGMDVVLDEVINLMDAEADNVWGTCRTKRRMVGNPLENYGGTKRNAD